MPRDWAPDDGDTDDVLAVGNRKLELRTTRRKVVPMLVPHELERFSLRDRNDLQAQPLCPLAHAPSLPARRRSCADCESASSACVTVIG